MAVGERLPRAEIEQMPTPGSLAHIKFLAEFDRSYPLSVQQFLTETMAPASFARIFRRHRIFREHRLTWPFNNITVAEIDSKLMPQAAGWGSHFRGSIDMSPPPKPFEFKPGEVVQPWTLRQLPIRNLLSISGRSRFVDEEIDDEASYSIIIPMLNAQDYDSSRDASAYLHLENQKVNGYTSIVYNEIADPKEPLYAREREPEVFITIMKKAASDLIELFNYPHGEVVRQGYPEVEVSWHPDYATDDPDEFLKKV